MTTDVTSAEILRHITAFLSDVVLNRDLRRRLISTLHRDQTTSAIPDEAAVKLAGDTLETAITLSSAASRSFSLSLAEKLLLPLSDHHHPLPPFLLSLIGTLRNRHLDAAVSLLRVFRSNPSLARSEIAPILYDRLFSLHLLAVFRWLLERRAQILSSDSEGNTHSLSKVSEEQASKLRELEKEYEEILDENCRVVAARFEEVLVSEDGNASIDAPLLTLQIAGEEGRKENEEEEEEEKELTEETETTSLKNGHYNNVRTMIYTVIKIQK